MVAVGNDPRYLLLRHGLTLKKADVALPTLFSMCLALELCTLFLVGGAKGINGCCHQSRFMFMAAFDKFNIKWLPECMIDCVTCRIRVLASLGSSRRFVRAEFLTAPGQALCAN